jgi:hypothetical protein
MLTSRPVALVSSGVFWITCGAVASAAPPTAGQAVHLLVGTYQCVDRESTGQTWRFTSVNDMFGAWLRVHAVHPPQNGASADTTTVFVGYDGSNKRWNIIGVDADGSYYTRSSRSAAFDGSRWQDDYPSDGGRAVVRTFGSVRYTFDFTLPTAKDASVKSHVVCTRT